MEYNKKDFTKANDKKVLHKIRKHWVVVSTALLMALGGEAAATHVSAHADTTNNNGTATKADAVKEQLNAKLQQPQQQQQSQQSASATDNQSHQSQQNQSAQSAQPAQPSTKVITKQAAALHQSILGNVAQQKPKANLGQQAPQVSQPQQSSSQQAAGLHNGVVNANQQKPKTLLGSGPSEPSYPAQDDNSADYYDNDKIFRKSTTTPNYTSNYNASDGGNIIYTPFSDANNGSDYGQISVKYINPTNNEIVSTVPDMEGQDGTPFKMSDYLKNMPHNGAYQLVNTGNNGYDSIDAGAGTTKFQAGRTQYVVINVNPAPKAGDGQILVQYENPYNNVNDHNQVLASYLQSDAAGKPFDIDGFTNNAPQGYQVDSYRFTDNDKKSLDVPANLADSLTDAKNDFPDLYNTSTSKFVFAAPNNSVGTYVLHVFVEPYGKTTNATINYMDGANVVDSRIISGTYSTANNADVIPMANYNSTIPSGYAYAGTKPSDLSGDEAMGSNASNAFKGGQYLFTPNNGTVIKIAVKKGVTPPAPIPLGYSNMTVHYQSDNNDVDTMTISGRNGSDVTSDQNAKIKSEVPDGYILNTSNDFTSKKFGVDHDINVALKKDPNYKIHPVVNDYVAYEYVTRDPETGEFSTTPTTMPSPKFQLSGYPGTLINYSPYINNVPSGYVYSGQMGVANSKMESNQTNYIILEKASDLTQPITVKYMNENGSDVTPYSPSYKDKVTGTFGQTYTVNQLKSDADTKIPSDYTLAHSDEGNQTYSISSNPQTVTIMVKGNPAPTSPTDASDVLNVYQHVSDGSGHVTTTPVAAVPISGTYGSVNVFHANNYLPSPSYNYSVINPNGGSDDYTQTVELAKNTGADAASHPIVLKRGTYNKTNNTWSWSDTNSITFNYKMDHATATVEYKYLANNNIVGQRSITGTPNENMSDFFENKNGALGLYNTPPYGYTKAPDQPDSSAKLVNGATYVINVDNAYVNPIPSTGPNHNRPGYGTITVQYGSGFGSESTPTVYDSVIVSGKNGSDFKGSDYTNTSASGHKYMPDYFTHPTATNNVTSFVQGQNQDYNINVDKDMTKYNKLVTDEIDYQPVKLSDNQWKDVGAAMKVNIQGAAGSNIDYNLYTTNIPNDPSDPSKAYAYSGMGTHYGQFASDITPIATIYVSLAQANTNGGGGSNTPGYDPSKADQETTSDGHGHKVTKQIPYNPFDSDGNAPLHGGFSHHKNTLRSPSTSDTVNDTGYDGGATDNDKSKPTGKLPDGYSPALVPETTNSDVTNPDGTKVMVSDGKGNQVPEKKLAIGANGKPIYHAGFVPSDHVPSGYVPGYVPAGKNAAGTETYIPGYVPSKPSDLPTNPKYVPGEIPNGHGGTVPGFVPDISPYAPKGQSANATVKYVDYNNQSDVLQTLTATAQVGQKLELKPAAGPINHPNSDTNVDGSNYLKDVPVGYTDPQILSITNGNGKTFPSSTTTLEYSDASVTPVITIGVSQKANANVVYIDKATNAQVGTAPISGYANQPMTLGSDYTTLLPYGYTFKASDNTNNLSIKLQNGNNYPIYLENGGYKPQTPVKPLKGYGTITVDYQYTNPSNVTTTVGTQQFTGSDGKTLFSDDGNISSDLTNGAPYGYKLDYDNPQHTLNSIAQMKFGNNPNNAPLKVKPVKTNGKAQPQSDVIAYYQVTSHYGGNDTISSTPVKTITIHGTQGQAINYTSYQNNVPSGYSYDGMGTHGDTFDSLHNGTDAQHQEVIYVKGAQLAPKHTAIYVNYWYKPSDSSSEQDRQLKVSGIQYNPFDLGYYQHNLPSDLAKSNFEFGSMQDGSSIASFTGSDQNVDINLTKKQVVQFGKVNIHFIDLSQHTVPTLPSKTPGETDAQYNASVNNALNGMDMGNNLETTSGKDGHIFSPEAYEYNLPKGYRFSQIIFGSGINSYIKNTTQDMYIGVVPDQTNPDAD